MITMDVLDPISPKISPACEMNRFRYVLIGGAESQLLVLLFLALCTLVLQLLSTHFQGLLESGALEAAL